MLMTYFDGFTVTIFEASEIICKADTIANIPNHIWDRLDLTQRVTICAKLLK